MKKNLALLGLIVAACGIVAWVGSRPAQTGVAVPRKAPSSGTVSPNLHATAAPAADSQAMRNQPTVEPTREEDRRNAWVVAPVLPPARAPRTEMPASRAPAASQKPADSAPFNNPAVAQTGPQAAPTWGAAPVVEEEIAVPAGASLPAAIMDDGSATSEGPRKALDNIAEDFVEKVTDPSKPEVADPDKWQDAQLSADALYRAIYGNERTEVYLRKARMDAMGLEVD